MNIYFYIGQSNQIAEIRFEFFSSSFYLDNTVFIMILMKTAEVKRNIKISLMCCLSVRVNDNAFLYLWW